MTERKPFIAVNITPAMSGYFATYYEWSKGEGGIDIHGNAYPEYWFPEPYETGIGRYATWQEANAEAELWAKQQNVEVKLATQELIDEMRVKLEFSTNRARAIKKIREFDTTLNFAEAKAIFDKDCKELSPNDFFQKYEFFYET